MKRLFICLFLFVSLCASAQSMFLSLQNSEYDFGKIGEKDGSVSTIFIVKNEGTESLLLSNVRASCGCTTPEWSKEPINPGEFGEIKVTYNPIGRPGRFQKTISIVATNGNTTNTARAYIKGEVVAGGKGITNRDLAKESSSNTSLKHYKITAYNESAQTSNISNRNTVPRSVKSAVDANIPYHKWENNNTYVLIIANETYSFLDKVNYATNDGKIFKEYCIKTLGIPEKQIFLYENASYGLIADGVSKLTYCLDNFENSKAIVYYCGHGIPDEKTGQAYLIPVDGKGTNMTTCYSLKNLYKTLAATKAESITYFMDACFTGANKEGSMLVAARGVAREPVKETLAGKTIVFSASSGDETAMTLEEQGHGLFTYYLLKKLQETEGNVTYGELADYINKNVKKDAFLINEKPQTPVVATSPAVQNTWKTMKLK